MPQGAVRAILGTGLSSRYSCPNKNYSELLINTGYLGQIRGSVVAYRALYWRLVGRREMEQRSDIELIEGAIAKNHKAFEELVTRYYRSVYGRIARHTLPWVDRDDIVQETFIAAYEKLAQLKEKERFEAWLCRIADNVLRKWHRRQIVQVEFDEACLDTAIAPVVSRDTESGDLMIAHLRTALKHLSVQHRQMLLHHDGLFWRGKEY